MAEIAFLSVLGKLDTFTYDMVKILSFALLHTLILNPYWTIASLGSVHYNAKVKGGFENFRSPVFEEYCKNYCKNYILEGNMYEIYLLIPAGLKSLPPLSVFR